MKHFRIKDWATLYENNRTRELKSLSWVPIPNKQDGDGYTLLMERKNGVALYGCWIACVMIASRCDVRGTLLRDGGKPHDSASLSRMSRIPEALIKEMLEVCSDRDLGWLEMVDYEGEATYSASSCDNPALYCDDTASECLEGKERIEGKEGNGKERAIIDQCKEVIEYLNQKTGKGFECVNGNLTPIRARLKEGFTVDKLKGVVDVKCAQWLNDPKMVGYLRPSTLFNSEKCAQYSGEISLSTQPKKWI